MSDTRTTTTPTADELATMVGEVEPPVCHIVDDRLASAAKLVGGEVRALCGETSAVDEEVLHEPDEDLICPPCLRLARQHGYVVRVPR